MTQVKVEPSLSFPIEGTPFQVDCYADGSEDKIIPDVNFVDGDNLVLKNTTTRYIVHSKDVGLGK